MIHRAVVYVPDSMSRAATGIRVAGRTILLRTLMTAERAGVGRIGLPALLRDAAIEADLAAYERLRAALVRLDGLGVEEAKAWSRGPLLLLPPNVLVDPLSLRRLLAGSDPGRESALEESKGSSPILLGSAARAASLWERLVAGAPLGQELEMAVRQGGMALVAGTGLLIPVLDEVSRREAEAALFRRLGIRADSPADRLLNRRCSRWLTRLLIRLPVTPNHVTLLSLGIGLAAAWMLWAATPLSALAGLILYMLAVVVDHSDGEIARLTFQESAFGEKLDFAVDTAIHALLVLAMGVTASRVGGKLVLFAGASAALGVILSALFARLRSRAPAPGERLSTLLAALGTRDPFYVALLAFALGLRVMPEALPWLVGLLALGTQGYWLTCLASRRLTRP